MAATGERAQEAVLDAEGMKRDVGLLGLLWASEGSIIGSIRPGPVGRTGRARVSCQLRTAPAERPDADGEK